VVPATGAGLELKNVYRDKDLLEYRMNDIDRDLEKTNEELENSAAQLEVEQETRGRLEAFPD